MGPTRTDGDMTGAAKRTPRLEDYGEVLSVDQVAVILDLSRDSAYAAVHRGEIPAIRLGRRLLVPKAALARMLGMTETREELAA
jgi:excisionase family DNA binding protein